MKATFSNVGHEVVEAPNGGSGYNIAVSERPDLIILDLIMPIVGGFEILKRLRETPETLAVPVILFTGDSAIKAEQAGIYLGVEHYISKPFKPAILEAAVRVILRSRGLIDDDDKEIGVEDGNERQENLALPVLGAALRVMGPPGIEPETRRL